MRNLNEMIIALKHSSTNTICKLISLVKKMTEKGLWLTYKQLEGDKSLQAKAMAHKLGEKKKLNFKNTIEESYQTKTRTEVNRNNLFTK